MAGTEGGFERVDIRNVWPNEGLDFTPWLAKNLHLLGRRYRDEVRVGPDGEDGRFLFP